jgi:hypothetical protein
MLIDEFLCKREVLGKRAPHSFTPPLSVVGVSKKISTPLRKHIQIYFIKNSSCGSLNFWSYTPWKIGFLASPETSLKQVFQVKTS